MAIPFYIQVYMTPKESVNIENLLEDLGNSSIRWILGPKLSVVVPPRDKDANTQKTPRWSPELGRARLHSSLLISILINTHQMRAFPLGANFQVPRDKHNTDYVAYMLAGHTQRLSHTFLIFHFSIFPYLSSTILI